MIKGNLDIRIIQLAKCQVPKSESMLVSMSKVEGAYLAIGYFDMIEIVEVQENSVDGLNGKRQHPLERAYCGLPRHGRTDILEEFTTQELIMFTDIGQAGISAERVARFWGDNSLLMFISLIHVDNESDIEQIIKRIQEKFEGWEYLYYYSFDYSGIVLLAKGMDVEVYTQLMFELNYEKVDEGKLIRDSFSMFGINKTEVEKYFKQAELGYEHIKEIPESKKFSVVVNIGVQNFNKYKEFLEKVEETNIQVKKCALLGRHDVSIINDDGDLKWLIYIQYLLDKFSTPHAKEEYGQMFSAYETFVKVGINEKLVDINKGDGDVYYDSVNVKLSELCEEFSRCLDLKKDKYDGEYQNPVNAVKHSVLSILRNRFAEDFVLCMYSSFCDFISYLTQKVSHEEDNPEEFEACYNEYFRGLNSMVNSAMHSERQFIQATAFNALIYDVPSKIMAFYVAIIYDMQQIIKSEEDKKYTFLLTPSFSNEISVRTISYRQENLPHDRILMVSVNEKFLYHPRGICRRMAHEVAHFVGDKIRKREYRKMYFVLSIINIILYNSFADVFVEADEFESLIERIKDSLPNRKWFNPDTLNYSEDLVDVGRQVMDEFVNNPQILEILYDYVQEVIRRINYGESETREKLKGYISKIIILQAGNLANLHGEILDADIWSETEMEIIRNLVMGDTRRRILHINGDWAVDLESGQSYDCVNIREEYDLLAQKTIGMYIQALKSAYSEAFADIQMALLLNFGYEDYLNGFLLDEKLTLGHLQNRMDDLMRISMVTLTLNEVGLWNELYQKKNFENNDSRLQELHEIIRAECIATMRGIGEMEGAEIARWDVSEFKREVNGGDENVGERRGYIDFWSDENDRNGGNANVFINIELLQYLILCTGISAKQYIDKDKIVKIRELRKTINTVIDCSSMKSMFKKICEEVNMYKEAIFTEGCGLRYSETGK